MPTHPATRLVSWPGAVLGSQDGPAVAQACSGGGTTVVEDAPAPMPDGQSGGGNKARGRGRRGRGSGEQHHCSRRRTCAIGRSTDQGGGDRGRGPARAQLAHPAWQPITAHPTPAQQPSPLQALLAVQDAPKLVAGHPIVQHLWTMGWVRGGQQVGQVPMKADQARQARQLLRCCAAALLPLPPTCSTARPPARPSVRPRSRPTAHPPTCLPARLPTHREAEGAGLLVSLHAVVAPPPHGAAIHGLHLQPGNGEGAVRWGEVG